MRKYEYLRTSPWVSMLFIVMAFLLLLVIAAGCAAAEAERGQTDSGHMSAEDLPPLTSAEVEAAWEMSDLHTAFAFDLMQALRQHDEAGNMPNRFVSPLSIATALAMTANGADGQTLTAMRHTLHMHEFDEMTINSGHEALLRMLNQDSGETTLSIANSLWGRDDIEFADAFLQTNADFYGAEVHTLPFDEETANRINAWVDEHTNGKISHIVEGPIAADTILFLLNAVYFAGNWSNPFDEANTAPAPFTAADGSQSEVPMMVVDGKFQYAEFPEYELVRLPYKGGSVAMYVFLPDEQSDLETLLESLSVQEWEAALASLQTALGTVRMPRFQLQYEAGLQDSLAALGMEVAFSRTEADYGRMVATTYPERVFLQSVRHKAFLDVTEEGTVAAAVTSVEVGATSAQPLERFELTVDRPFFFIIHDGQTESILFVGEVRSLDGST